MWRSSRKHYGVFAMVAILSPAAAVAQGRGGGEGGGGVQQTQAVADPRFEYVG